MWLFTSSDELAHGDGSEKRGQCICRGIQFLPWHHCLNQTDGASLLCVDSTATRCETLSLLLPDRADQVWPDHRGYIAKVELSDLKTRVLRCDHEFAGANKSDAGTRDKPANARDRRFGS